jgi:hypothetical protein
LFLNNDLYLGFGLLIALRPCYYTETNQYWSLSSGRRKS